MKIKYWEMPIVRHGYLRRVPPYSRLWALDPKACDELRVLLGGIKKRDDAYLAHPSGSTFKAYEMAEQRLRARLVELMVSALVEGGEGG